MKSMLGLLYDMKNPFFFLSLAGPEQFVGYSYSQHDVNEHTDHHEMVDMTDLVGLQLSC